MSASHLCNNSLSPFLFTFFKGGAQLYNGTIDHDVNGPIWIHLEKDEPCTGNERSLAECKNTDLWIHDHYCDHSEDAAITCNSEEDLDDIDGSRFGTDVDTIIFSETDSPLTNEATISVAGASEDCGKIRIVDISQRILSESVLPRIAGKKKERKEQLLKIIQYTTNALPVKINYYEIFTLAQTDSSMKTWA